MLHLGLFLALVVARVTVLEDMLGQEGVFGAARAVGTIRQRGGLFPVVLGERGGQKLVGFAWCIWRLRVSQTRYVCSRGLGLVSDVPSSILRLCQLDPVEEELRWR